jgi:hypothetical protein
MLGLFANGIWDVLVPVGFVVFWIVASIFRGINETKATAPKRNAAPPPEKRPDPRKELERFLDELGAGKPAQKPAPQPIEKPIRLELPKAVAAPQRPAKPPKPPKEHRRTEAKSSVRDRHLHSRLEDRKREEMHSRLEQQHMEPTIGATRTPTERPPQLEVVVVAKEEPMGSGPALTNLPLKKTELARAFILSTVFGPPRALQEFDIHR